MDISRLEDFLVTSFSNDLSDHDAQILTINIPIQIHPNKPKFARKINKYTTLDFIYNLSNESWEEVFKATDINLMFNSFLNIYLRIFYSCFPIMQSKNSKYKNSWITLGIRTSCKRKRELFSLIRNNNNTTMKQYYKVYCKILTKVIKDAKRMTLNKRIYKSNNKIKTTWNIINELLGKQQPLQSIQKLIIDGTQLTNQQDIANALNKHFPNEKNSVSNGDKLDNMKHNKPFANSNFEQGRETLVPPLVFKLFSTKEITQIIKSLKTKNSSGYDEINTKLLKISVNYISSPLTYIVNKSISAGIFLERLKFSIIKPLFKKGDRTIPSNYRPISLLTAFSKVIEKALYNRLIDHLNTNNLIHPQQFGFR